MTQVHGAVDPRFARVKDAFASCFADGYEHGASVAVILDGKLVADLWAGHADQAKTKPWQRDTIVNVWSCTKGVVATAIAMLVDRGLLRYDEPIAKLWPEFGSHSKDTITPDQVMSHCSGINGFSEPMDLDRLCDWNASIKTLEKQTPNWQPGTACAYHALTYGHLASEPLRRATGKSIGRFIADEIAGPLGVEFFVGVPDHADHRCAEIIEGPLAYDWVNGVLKSPYPQACVNPTPNALWPHDRRWRAAEIPGGNGHCGASALATIYGSLTKIMSADAVAEAARVRYRGLDSSFGFDTVWAAGFRIEDKINCPKASPGTVSHGGWGGSFGFGDPQAKLGFAFVTSHMMAFDDGIDKRRTRLIEAVYDAL
jgi:CubicO group peptidase (beta-lactamase class C family)